MFLCFLSVLKAFFKIRTRRFALKTDCEDFVTDHEGLIFGTSVSCYENLFNSFYSPWLLADPFLSGSWRIKGFPCSHCISAGVGQLRESNFLIFPVLKFPVKRIHTQRKKLETAGCTDVQTAPPCYSELGQTQCF